MEEITRGYRKFLNTFRSNLPHISLGLLVCIVLLAVFLILFKRSYGISCEEYCPTKPHAACVGYWNISGGYPNCNCEYICWSSRTCFTDSDCRSGEACYRSYDNGQQLGDMLCHTICSSDSDCPDYAPLCRRISITIGSYSDAIDMCMAE